MNDTPEITVTDEEIYEEAEKSSAEVIKRAKERLAASIRERKQQEDEAAGTSRHTVTLPNGLADRASESFSGLTLSQIVQYAIEESLEKGWLHVGARRAQ